MFQMETLAGKWQPNLVHAGFSPPPSRLSRRRIKKKKKKNGGEKSSFEYSS